MTQLDTPSGFGRIVRNELGNIVAIVEHKDASERELKINQVNTGIIHAPVSFLQANLPLLNNKKCARRILFNRHSVACSEGGHSGEWRDGS